MLLFTKPACTKCEDIKSLFNLPEMGVEEKRLTPDDPDALAELAYYECVELAERELPILVANEGQIYSGKIPIKKFLQTLIN